MSSCSLKSVEPRAAILCLEQEHVGRLLLYRQQNTTPQDCRPGRGSGWSQGGAMSGIEIINVLEEVLERQASDLHLVAGAPPIVRVNGALEPLDQAPLDDSDTRELIYSILSPGPAPAPRERARVGLLLLGARPVPLPRQRLLPAQLSLGAAFRLIPVEIPSLDDLGLPRVLHEFAAKPRGFVVVTGPTGSGKSTTLAAMVDEINATSARAHHDDRGPDRVPALAQEVDHQPARGGARHEELRAGAEVACCARTPTSSWSARCATPRRWPRR